MKIWICKHKEEIILSCFLLVVISMFLFRFGSFASEVDWLGQHSVFPDYFRRLFYRTGKLFPSFGANIGGGQNIYNFSYYGLFSPLILPSYLLPFLPMSYYLMGVSALCLLASVLLLYRWLLSRGMGRGLSCAMALIWLFAAPIIYQSHTQWMFVNYMPFLILAFIGIDWYMEKGKPGLMTAAIFLMIMTSYYYSIAGILALGLYQLAFRVRQMEHFKLITFIKREIFFGCYILLSVAMSGILLLPTAYTLLGRSDSGKDIYTLAELLLPKVVWGNLAYSTYGIGLTTLLVTAVLSALFCRRAWERVLGFSLWAVLFVPVFAWLLNGGLYIRGKSLIPFLPLLIYWISHFLVKIKRKEISVLQGGICFGATVLLVFIYGDGGSGNFGVLIADAVVMLAAYFLYAWYSGRESKRVPAVKEGKGFFGGGEVFLVAPVVLLLVGSFVYGFFTEDNSISEELFAYTEDKEPGRIIDGLLQDNSFGYRAEKRGGMQEDFADVNRIYTDNQRISTLYSSAYAARYSDFRQEFHLNKTHRNVLIQGSSCNPLFLRLMGVKYLISNRELPFEEMEVRGDYHVYDCGLTAPLAYVTDLLISEEEYDKLSFPYNQLALAGHAVADNGVDIQAYQQEKAVEPVQETGQEEFAEKAQKSHWQEELTEDVREIDWQKAFFAQERDFAETEDDGGYHIKLKESAQVQVEFPEKMDGSKLFCVSFHVANHHRGSDVSVDIGPEKNKLSAYYLYYNNNTTFYYVGRFQGESIPVTFSSGDYTLSELKCYVADWPADRGEELYQSPMAITDGWTDADTLSGTLKADRDGFLVTSIPYDEGFHVFVDGEESDIKLANKGFLGVEIVEGEHEISVCYESPGRKAGGVLSIVGILLFAAERLILWRKKIQEKGSGIQRNRGH